MFKELTNTELPNYEHVLKFLENRREIYKQANIAIEDIDDSTIHILYMEFKNVPLSANEIDEYLKEHNYTAVDVYNNWSVSCKSTTVIAKDVQ